MGRQHEDRKFRLHRLDPSQSSIPLAPGIFTSVMTTSIVSVLKYMQRGRDIGLRQYTIAVLVQLILHHSAKALVVVYKEDGLPLCGAPATSAGDWERPAIETFPTGRPIRKLVPLDDVC